MVKLSASKFVDDYGFLAFKSLRSSELYIESGTFDMPFRNFMIGQDVK